MRLMLDPNAKRIFWYLFAGSRGGNNRIKIIKLLKEHPHNINQLAEALGLDYKAIQHHISVLEKNNMVSKVGEKYGVSYFISDYLESNIIAFDEIAHRIKKRTK
jgi:DNA-binding transcriptional ArsR family regulator